MKIDRTVAMSASRAATEGEGSDLVRIAVSSEAPYERFFGIEILRHSATSVDMTRLGDGRHPLLLNHDTEKQIGVVKKA